MARYRSKPSEVEAVQWVGTDWTPVESFYSNWHELRKFASGKVEWEGSFNEQMKLRAGKDGAQGWVVVPKGHWIVRSPGDPSDYWPVEDSYFRTKYEAMGETADD